VNKEKRAVFKASICTAAAACFILLCAVLFSAYKLQNPKPASLDSEEERLFLKTAEDLYPFSPLTPLFWNKDEAGITKNPPVYAFSALLADLKTGSILYEKNADILIPPASMTKLIAMYIVFQDAAAHKFSLDDVVPLKAESWAVNAPEGSSLMFLAKGQRVSVRELLLGLAVASGNDAAAAIADFVSGSQSAFVERMNAETEKLGLRYTRFADASGYSELNATTAREFASFARTYLHLYPEALKEFHSVQTLRYPQSHNNPRENQSPPVVQKNTNPALGVIPGANGLKTGFIPESGYNLSLTVERDNLSILSVTLGGPGQGTVQGNAYRLKDAQSLTDYAYNNFKTASIADSAQIPVGIIGGTGSAKTTLVQLIPRLYDVSEGALYVGGKNVRSYDLNALRGEVAMVLQKNELFSGTIKENLRWGNENASDEELESACRASCADEFIRAMSDGYDTHIEQGGANVSGGQKQRLCIARALLKKPKILILDDSTSAVDTKTDARIRQALADAIPGTTKIIIAQRVSSVQHADMILVMDEGKISATGTHEELLAKSDIYRDVYLSQQKGSEDNE